MSQIDYEELIRSPLDDLDDDPISPWWAAGGGLVVGALVGYLLMLVTGGGEATTTTIVPVTTDTAAPPVVAEAPDYPDGYTEIAPDLGARINEIIAGDEVITVAFATAVVRGADPAEVDWPRGGSWLLRSTSGTTVESSRVVIGGFSPGAFSVQFPAAPFGGETSFDTIRLLERWDTEHFAGSTVVPFTGEPFSIEESLSLPVSQQITLLIPRLEIGRFQGLIEWQVVGAELGANVHGIVRLLDGDDGEVGSYAAFPQIREPGNDGVIDVNWQRSFPIDQEGAVTLVVEYLVDVVRSMPVSIELFLDGVPVGR